jgi:hypothetical protein
LSLNRASLDRGLGLGLGLDLDPRRFRPPFVVRFLRRRR